MTKEEFSKLFLALCEVFNKAPSKILADIYYKLFKQYSYQEFEHAVAECIKSNKYNVLPKPAELLEYLQGSKEDQTLLAWTQAKEGVQKVGYTNTPDFKDPIISHCIAELGGWQKFCQLPVDELPFVEKEFFKLYRLFKQRKVVEAVPLPGYYEIVNNNTGYAKPDPIQIGYDNPKKMIGGN